MSVDIARYAMLSSYLKMWVTKGAVRSLMVAILAAYSSLHLVSITPCFCSLLKTAWTEALQECSSD